MIPQAFIDDLLLRTDIVSTIGERFRLRKTGKNYVGLCPFHQEKTPSFNVNQDKQFYHCFGCGKSGNVIGFLIDYDKLTFVEAVTTLAASLGMSLPKEVAHQQQARGKQQDKVEPLYRLLTDAAAFYQKQLQTHPKATVVRDYLKNRGISEQVITHFQLGYAPPGWDNLLKEATRLGYSTVELNEAGLIVERDGGKRYDRFRDRVLFPIRDHLGRVVGFGGRVLDESLPKYLNSPETPVFHKSAQLYGLFEAHRAYRDLHSVVLVEGYMDVIGLFEHDLRCAVATLGTSVSTSHFQRVFRYTDRVVCCFDGDNAGRQAAWRALESSLPCLNEKNSICFLLLPEGDDPDSLIAKEGKAAFVARLQEAMPLSDFLLSHVSGQHQLSSLDGRARFIQALAPILAKLRDDILHGMLVERVAKLCHTSEEKIQLLLTRAAHTKKQQQQPIEHEQAMPVHKTQHKRLTPMRLAISIMLQYPACVSAILDEALALLNNVDIAGIAILTTLVARLRENPKLTTAALLEHWRNKSEFNALNQLASWPLMLPEEGITAELQGVINRIKQLTFEKQIDALMAKARHTGLSDSERAQLNALLYQPKIAAT